MYGKASAPRAEAALLTQAGWPGRALLASGSSNSQRGPRHPVPGEGLTAPGPTVHTGVCADRLLSRGVSRISAGARVTPEDYLGPWSLRSFPGRWHIACSAAGPARRRWEPEPSSPSAFSLCGLFHVLRREPSQP